MVAKIISIFAFSILVGCSSPEAQEKTHVNSLPSSEVDFEYNSYIGRDYLLDAQHSYLGFKIKYFGFSPVRGRFDDFEGTLFYDPKDQSHLSVTINIDVQSINSGNEDRDTDLKKEGSWFDSGNYPRIFFQSSRSIPKPGGGFALHGILNIKDIEKEVAIEFQAPTLISKDWAGNDQVDFSGRLVINRQDFGVVGGDFWSSVMENGLTQLSDEVEIELDIHARRADYQIRYDDADGSDVRKLILMRFHNNQDGEAMQLVDSLYSEGALTPGILSTVGYTLNAWERHDEALTIFEKRKLNFPSSRISIVQIGITQMLLGNTDLAARLFRDGLIINDVDSRLTEYLRLVDKIR